MPHNTKTSASLTQLTLDELILSAEGSPANHTASPESERANSTSATCGPRCCALYENAPRATLWGRTFAGLLIGTEGWSSKRCALTWKMQGTPFNRSFFQLAVSAHPTDGTEFGLLLTPTTREEVMDTEKFKERMEKYNNGTTVPNLATQVLGLLPTPTKDKREKKYAQGGTNLRAAIGATSQLSPLFVEEMMGYPKNWTALPFLNGDGKESKPTETP